MKRTRSICFLALRLVLLLTLAASAWPSRVSGADPKRVAVRRTSAKISIDGALDEPDWAQASSLGEILQREPKEEALATERTEVKLLADKDNLYVGVICYDSEPSRIVSTQMARDANLESDDRVEILLDTFHDRRNAFYFATNPAGALVDGLIIENGRNINLDWNAIWDVRVKRLDKGWLAEFAIPFKSLSFTPGQDTWGFNISRRIIRKLEEDRWAAPRLDVRFNQVSEAGEITGFAEVEQGRGLDARPYAIGKWTRDGRGNHSFQGKGGADIFYNITPGLKLTTTINTDFAEAEVDNRQINLTRFSLFFPEKRSFFLENAGVFNYSNFFGDTADVIPFFSRRVGLLNGQEVPITAGVKLTGKAGEYDVGALAVRTREIKIGDELIGAKNFFVGRVKRNLFKQSYIGAIYTEGDPESPATSRTYGADLRLATSNFLGADRNFSVDAFAIKTGKEDVRSDDSAYGFSVRYPNDRWFGVIEWNHIGKNFNPALGFVQRPADDKLAIRAEFNPRPKDFLNVRQMFHEFGFTMYRRNDLHRVESWRLFTAPINWDLNSGEHIEFNWAPQFERLFAPFEIAQGVTLPPGDYPFTRWRTEFNSAQKRPWVVDIEWWFGEYWSGRANQINTGFTYKFAPHFLASLMVEQTFAHLKQGSFVARIYAVKADYAFSPFLTISNLIQFDNESRNLGWQSRLRWILRPGNDLFLVFNQGWLQGERGGFNFRGAGTKLAMKFQYTFRF